MRKSPKVIYLVTFLLGIQLALPIYVNSTFLALYISERAIGILYTASAALSGLLFVILPRVLRRFGNYRSTLAAGAIQAVLLIALPLSNVPLLIGFFFLYLAVVHLLPYHLDIFLEDASKDATTGRTRGAYLTIASLGFLVAPLITGIVLADHDFWKIYLLSAALLLGTLIIIKARLCNFRDPRYHSGALLQGLRQALRRKPIYRICMANLLLYIFYSWMVIYLPLYLNQHIGFDWRTIGLIFTAMLAPFALIEWPLGWIADRWLGEKEMLVAGFIIMAISTGILSFISNATILVWMAALVATRIGASMVETMNMTYFFKHVTSADAPLISIFHLTKPAAFVLGPLLAVLALSFIDIKYLFLVLGAIMLLGLRYSLRLKDTK